MVPLVHHLQLIFDAGYFVRTEIGAIVEAMAAMVEAAEGEQRGKE